MTHPSKMFSHFPSLLSRNIVPTSTRSQLNGETSRLSIPAFCHSVGLFTAQEGFNHQILHSFLWNKAFQKICNGCCCFAAQIGHFIIAIIIVWPVLTFDFSYLKCAHIQQSGLCSCQAEAEGVFWGDRILRPCLRHDDKVKLSLLHVCEHLCVSVCY